MQRSLLILVALLAFGCEIVIEDPNGLRNKNKGERIDLSQVDLTALKEATASSA